MAMDVLKAAGRVDGHAPGAVDLKRWQDALAVDAKLLRDAEGAGDATDEASEVGSQASSGPDAAERLVAKKHAEAAQQTVGALLGAASHGLSVEVWEGKRREHDRLVKEGHKANNAGSAQGAMECFEGAAQALPKTSTLISALNMRLKLGGGARGGRHARVCACAYTALLRTPLPPNERDLTAKKLAECVAGLPELIRELVSATDDAVDNAAHAYGRAALEAQVSWRAPVPIPEPEPEPEPNPEPIPEP